MGNGHMGPPIPICEQTDTTENIKQYLPATSLAGGNKQMLSLKLRATKVRNLIALTLHELESG